MVIVNRSASASITKKLFLSIVFYKRITYKKGKRGGLIERTDSDREKEMELILKGHTPGVFKEHMNEVIDYLNKTENLLVPITRLELID